MANTDKDIVITPNKGQTADPVIAFRGANATVGAQTIYANVYPNSGGTISFEGSAGQLFSITNSLTGTIFSVNDVSGIPSIEVLDSGLIRLAQYGGNVGIGTGTAISGARLSVAGLITQSGDQVLDVGGGQTISGGFSLTPYNIGNSSGATITPSPTNGNYQYLSNNGAATINAPVSDCAIDILVINTTGAAAFTFSGYTVVAGSTGDTAPTTSTTADWIISIRRINAVATYVIKVIAT